MFLLRVINFINLRQIYFLLTYFANSGQKKNNKWQYYLCLKIIVNN